MSLSHIVEDLADLAYSARTVVRGTEIEVRTRYLVQRCCNSSLELWRRRDALDAYEVAESFIVNNMDHMLRHGGDVLDRRIKSC